MHTGESNPLPAATMQQPTEPMLTVAYNPESYETGTFAHSDATCRVLHDDGNELRRHEPAAPVKLKHLPLSVATQVAGLCNWCAAKDFSIRLARQQANKRLIEQYPDL